MQKLTEVAEVSTNGKNGHRAQLLEKLIGENGSAAKSVEKPRHLVFPKQLDKVIRNALPPNLINEEYQWWSEDNFALAEELVSTVDLVWDGDALDPVARPVAIGAAQRLAELFHQDRAERACEIVGEDVVPVRESGLPNLSGYDLESQAFSYDFDKFPEDDFNIWHTVGLVLKFAKPDEILFAEFVERRRSRAYDPFIFAKYGNWWVQVAHWE